MHHRKAERKTAVASGPVTIDVDAMWAQMTGSGATTETTRPAAENARDGTSGEQQGGPGAGEEEDEGERERDVEGHTSIRRLCDQGCTSLDR